MFELKIWLMDKLGYLSGGEYGTIFSHLLTIGYLAIILLLSLLIIGIIIIVNQVKLKKQLRQLQEMLKEKEVTSSGDQTATDETNQKS